MAMSVHRQLTDILQRQIQDADFPKEEADTRSQGELLSKALCAGFFSNVARKATTGHGFRTMEGHGTTVFIHPSSVLFGSDDNLDWVIYHEIIWTSKIFMRNVCSVKYEWVKDLLPRLHEVDAYGLSGCLAPKFTKEEEQDAEKTSAKQLTKNIGKTKSDTLSEEDKTKVMKRNDDTSISDARQRYLERKKARPKP